MAKAVKNPKIYNDADNPPACWKCGGKMLFKGYGAFPYHCTAKEMYPQAPVFSNCENNCGGGWTHGCDDNGWAQRQAEHTKKLGVQGNA